MRCCDVGDVTILRRRRCGAALRGMRGARSERVAAISPLIGATADHSLQPSMAIFRDRLSRAAASAPISSVPRLQNCCRAVPGQFPQNVVGTPASPVRSPWHDWHITTCSSRPRTVFVRNQASLDRADDRAASEGELDVGLPHFARRALPLPNSRQPGRGRAQLVEDFSRPRTRPTSSPFSKGSARSRRIAPPAAIATSPPSSCAKLLRLFRPDFRTVAGSSRGRRSLAARGQGAPVTAATARPARQVRQSAGPQLRGCLRAAIDRPGHPLRRRCG